MRVYGQASRAGVGDEGIEVPIEALVVSAELAAARVARQNTVLGIGVLPAPAARKRRVVAPEIVRVSMTPVPRRVSTPPPAPALPPAPPPAPPVPDVVAAIEELVPTGPVSCGICHQVVTPEFVARTGLRIHPPCRDRQHQAASHGSTGPARAHHQLVGAASGGRS